MNNKIKDELNKISNMDRDQKWEYFKAYYLVKTVLIVIGIMLLIWFVKDTVFQKMAVTSGCVYGIEITEEEKGKLTDGYLEYYGYNPKKYCAYISTDNMFEGTEQQMDANSHEMALFAQVAAGEIYYFILDKDTLDMMTPGGIYADLSKVFPNGLPDGFKDCEIELVDEETKEPYLAAIDLEKAGIFNDGRKGYLVFTIGIPDKDYPQRLLNYLKNM